MRTHAWLALCVAVLTQPLLANGGGYLRGGVEKAGDLAGFEPGQTDKIRILDEKLTVALGPRDADVEVRYLMRNETDKKVKVRFGFPVEESFDTDFGGEANEYLPKDAGNLKYCQDYVITAGGKAVSTKWQAEERPATDKRMKGIEGWLISEITFSAGEEKPVMIRFRSGYPFEEWSVSDNVSHNSSLFRYRLSTAACWAGTIGTGRITLKPAGIDPAELKVIKPVNRFKREGENWVWNFENLEPTMADDLEIEASPAEKGYGEQDKMYVERGDQWSMKHVNYQVKASSTLPPSAEGSYEADKVKRFWSGEAWSEGAAGSGAGEWLELVPVVPKPLKAIEIDPGFTKSEELFRANARPKKILVELNRDHRFKVDVSDSKAALRIPVRNYTKAVSKIRLTFEEVWPGSKFEDLCVSGVRLEVKLDKKPKIGPVR